MVRGFHESIRNAVLQREADNGVRYQPTEQPQLRSIRPNSSFTERLAIAKAAVMDSESRNVLDIGCAEGYFVRELARDPGILGLGLDADWAALRRGTAPWLLNQEEGYGFLPWEFDADSLLHLPKFDLVICFSVVHHVIRHEGRASGVDFLRSCAAVTAKKFLFDMGGPLESGYAWAEKLDFLGSDEDSVAQNVKVLLEEAGFLSVREVGRTAGNSKFGLRSVFVCDPPRAPVVIR